jgi:hypothetical protein
VLGCLRGEVKLLVDGLSIKINLSAPNLRAYLPIGDRYTKPRCCRDGGWAQGGALTWLPLMVYTALISCQTAPTVGHDRPGVRGGSGGLCVDSA